MYREPDKDTLFTAEIIVAIEVMAETIAASATKAGVNPAAVKRIREGSERVTIQAIKKWLKDDRATDHGS